MNPEFWRNRKVLLTGHTGFKGSWLSLWLQSLGTKLGGYSLPPFTDPSLFLLAELAKEMNSVEGDVRDVEKLRHAVQTQRPEIVFHLAAQALVRRSYADPVGTYATNVMGTVHLLEAVRQCPSVRAVVVVTSDKCYENRDDGRAYCETDRLAGSDPYSSSKAAAELVCAAYRSSFFANACSVEPNRSAIALASARAGNVIGGGDWSADRLIPDAMRAALTGVELVIRNPHAVRPWQHVLEPLCGYLTLAEKLWDDPERFSGGWNFGPREAGMSSVSDMLSRLKTLWGPAVSWRLADGAQPHEARVLRLDCAKAKTELGWEPHWNLTAALEATVEWYKAYQDRQDVRSVTQEQIRSYQSLTNDMTPAPNLRRN